MDRRAEDLSGDVAGRGGRFAGESAAFRRASIAAMCGRTGALSRQLHALPRPEQNEATSDQRNER